MNNPQCIFCNSFDIARVCKEAPISCCDKCADEKEIKKQDWDNKGGDLDIQFVQW